MCSAGLSAYARDRSLASFGETSPEREARRRVGLPIPDEEFSNSSEFTAAIRAYHYRQRSDAHVMDPFLIWLESTAFSTWMREDPSVFAFPAVLSVHTIGMALIVGIGIALDLRILGVGRDVPIGEMKRFFVPMWIGFWLNVVSGLALLAAYPTKALTNPVFYTKLILIAIALVLFLAIRRRVFREGEALANPMPARLRAMAAASIFCWASAITAGRLLAYTYTRLMATF